MRKLSGGFVLAAAIGALLWLPARSRPQTSPSAARPAVDQRLLFLITNNVDIHGGYRPAGFWWNALARGLKLGVQASSDHISTHTSYAMIYTPSNDRKAIVESMRQRHAYAATDNILVDFEAEASGGVRHLMGDAFVDPNGQPKLIAKIEGTDKIKQVDLIRNNQFVYTASPDNKSADFTYTDRNPTPGESYYYLRVMQVDGNLAWSSPIWIKR